MTAVSDLGLTNRNGIAVQRSLQWVASTALGARALAPVTPGLDAAVGRLSAGRATFVEDVVGLRTIHLTTLGARTGLRRTVPLVALVDDDAIAVIGSNWGRPHHPAWVFNLLASPQATVTWRTRSVDVTAHEAQGVAAERIWRIARSTYRGFRTYPARAEGRTIRVFRLTA